MIETELIALEPEYLNAPERFLEFVPEPYPKKEPTLIPVALQPNIVKPPPNTSPAEVPIEPNLIEFEASEDGAKNVSELE